MLRVVLPAYTRRMVPILKVKKKDKKKKKKKKKKEQIQQASNLYIGPLSPLQKSVWANNGPL